MTDGDGAENIVGYEVEHQLLQVLHGTHVPRFVAAGDLARLPYLVMEYIEGRCLQEWLDEAIQAQQRPSAEEIARLGAAMATAVHSLHLQERGAPGPEARQRDDPPRRQRGAAGLRPVAGTRTTPTCWPKRRGCRSARRRGWRRSR